MRRASSRLLVSVLLPTLAATAQERSPSAAYAAGEFQEALDGFVELQIERPEDPDLLLNVGASQYRLGDFDAAATSFAQAAASDDPSVQAEAYYNLGNTSYRRGQLEEAVGYYEASLDRAPDDEDAKFNLEFVREEVRRRQQETEKQQQEQQSRSESSEAPSAESRQDPEGAEQQGAPSPPPAGPDRDGDGLPDAVEEQGANPTDPDRPDSDGDGLLDGQEDLDRDGNLDEGETDPNRADSDGDGTPDAEEIRPAEAEAEPGDESGLTEAEAARFLDALEEGQPRRRVPATQRRVEKDW